jgi:hypothetical protein
MQSAKAMQSEEAASAASAASGVGVGRCSRMTAI